MLIHLSIMGIKIGSPISLFWNCSKEGRVVFEQTVPILRVFFFTIFLTKKSPFKVCAILDNWSAKCWGYNSNGQLGAMQNAVVDLDEIFFSPATLGPHYSPLTSTIECSWWCWTLRGLIKCLPFTIFCSIGFWFFPAFHQKQLGWTAGPFLLQHDTSWMWQKFVPEKKHAV